MVEGMANFSDISLTYLLDFVGRRDRAFTGDIVAFERFLISVMQGEPSHLENQPHNANSSAAPAALSTSSVGSNEQHHSSYRGQCLPKTSFHDTVALEVSRRIMQQFTEDHNKHRLVEFLISCPEERIRSSFARIIGRAAQTLAASVPEQISVRCGLEWSGILAPHVTKVEGLRIGASLVSRLVGLLVEVQSEVAKQWSKAAEYFELLAILARTQSEKLFLTKEDLRDQVYLQIVQSSIVFPIAHLVSESYALLPRVVDLLLGEESTMYKLRRGCKVLQPFPATDMGVWAGAAAVWCTLVRSRIAVQGFPVSSISDSMQIAAMSHLLPVVNAHSIFSLPLGLSYGAVGTKSAALPLYSLVSKFTQAEECIIASASLWTRSIGIEAATNDVVAAASHLLWANPKAWAFFSHVASHAVTISTADVAPAIIRFAARVLQTRDLDPQNPVGLLKRIERTAVILGDPHAGTYLAGAGMGFSLLGGYASPGNHFYEAAEVGPLSEEIMPSLSGPPFEQVKSWLSAIPLPPDAESHHEIRKRFMSDLHIWPGSGLLRALQSKLHDMDIAPMRAALEALLEFVEGSPLATAYIWRLPGFDPSSEGRFADTWFRWLLNVTHEVSVLETEKCNFDSPFDGMQEAMQAYHARATELSSGSAPTGNAVLLDRCISMLRRFRRIEYNYRKFATLPITCPTDLLHNLEFLRVTPGKDSATKELEGSALPGALIEGDAYVKHGYVAGTRRLAVHTTYQDLVLATQPEHVRAIKRGKSLFSTSDRSGKSIQVDAIAYYHPFAYRSHTATSATSGMAGGQLSYPHVAFVVRNNVIFDIKLTLTIMTSASESSNFTIPPPISVIVRSRE
jgi:hypothetical protein